MLAQSKVSRDCRPAGRPRAEMLIRSLQSVKFAGGCAGTGTELPDALGTGAELAGDARAPCPFSTSVVHPARTRARVARPANAARGDGLRRDAEATPCTVPSGQPAGLARRLRSGAQATQKSRPR